MNNQDGIFCKDCNHQLDETLESRKDTPCPKCGSTQRYMNISVIEGVNIYDSSKAQAKNPNYPSKNKVRWETSTGWEYSHRLQKMVYKTRTIDKEDNKYQETVIDPDTKEVIHHCEEPLSDHVGHGSAKPKPSQDT